ncbi:MAG: DNA polymerase III subunit delta [Sphingobacteriaceae bacterium]|nr:DNA polymerase III subunit delta [Sphingobacteriaceae bacterium]
MKEVDKIITDLKRKIFKPVYFLSGEETYYIDLISNYIEENTLEESEREFNQHVVYGKDVDLSAVVGLCKQFPMMSEYQVIIVKEAQGIKEFSKTSAGDEEGQEEIKSQKLNGAQLFTSYISNPLSSTILVICYKHKTIDKRSALAKAIQKNAVFFETKKMYDSALQGWITDYIKRLGFAISPKGAFLLAEFLGNDLSKITNEVGKLIINLKPGVEITPEIIQNQIGISKDFNVFEFQDALGAKDVLKANRIANYFAENLKDNPNVLTLATLFAYFSKILKYHFLKDKSKFAAAGALGVNPFFVDAIAKGASYYGTAKLKNIFSLLKEYDLKSKGVNNNGFDQGALLKELTFKILH